MFSHCYRQPGEAYNLWNLTSEHFKYVPRAMWSDDEPIKFFTPENSDHVSHSVVSPSLARSTAESSPIDTDQTSRSGDTTSSSADDADAQTGSSSGFIWVPTVTASRLLGELKSLRSRGLLLGSWPPALLKLDVEGAESFVLTALFSSMNADTAAPSLNSITLESSNNHRNVDSDNSMGVLRENADGPDSSSSMANWKPQQILVEFDDIMKPTASSVQRRRVIESHELLVKTGYALAHTDGKANFLYLLA